MNILLKGRDSSKEHPVGMPQKQEWIHWALSVDIRHDAVSEKATARERKRRISSVQKGQMRGEGITDCT